MKQLGDIHTNKDYFEKNKSGAISTCLQQLKDEKHATKQQ